MLIQNPVVYDDSTKQHRSAAGSDLSGFAASSYVAQNTTTADIITDVPVPDGATFALFWLWAAGGHGGSIADGVTTGISGAGGAGDFFQGGINIPANTKTLRVTLPAGQTGSSPTPASIGTLITTGIAGNGEDVTQNGQIATDAGSAGGYYVDRSHVILFASAAGVNNYRYSQTLLPGLSIATAGAGNLGLQVPSLLATTTQTDYTQRPMRSIGAGGHGIARVSGVTAAAPRYAGNGGGCVLVFMVGALPQNVVSPVMYDNAAHIHEPYTFAKYGPLLNPPRIVRFDTAGDHVFKPLAGESTAIVWAWGPGGNGGYVPAGAAPCVVSGAGAGGECRMGTIPLTGNNIPILIGSTYTSVGGHISAGGGGDGDNASTANNGAGGKAALNGSGGILLTSIDGYGGISFSNKMIIPAGGISYNGAENSAYLYEGSAPFAGINGRSIGGGGSGAASGTAGSSEIIYGGKGNNGAVEMWIF